MNFKRKVIRNILKRRQGNNKIKGIFQYIQKQRKARNYKEIKKTLKEV